MTLIETHAHLDYPDFAPDFDDVLRRANEAGVTRIITIGTSIESSRRAIELAEKYPNIFAVIGVHPTYAGEAPDDVMTPLRELAKNPRVVALGESGLDYHSLPSKEVAKDKKVQMFANALQGETEEQIDASIADGAYKSKQAMLFEQQLDLAVELGLNVVIHQRDAWSDTLEIMQPYTDKLRGVFHCFGGTREQAEEVIALDHLISFTGIVTFKKSDELRSIAASLPADRFLVETDAPYLAPGRFRGKCNEPSYIVETAKVLSIVRGLPFDDLARQTTDNFFSLFNKVPRPAAVAA
jgi:TatD DNase family protein